MTRPARCLPILCFLFALPGIITASVSEVFALPADGFDLPVGKPDGEGYYRARGFRSNGHLGEDWNGRGGGNTDLGDPVYSIGSGVVVFSKDQREGWGNVVIVRHAYRESNGRIDYIDSLYGHLDERHVSLHDTVKRGQQIGTIGTNRGMYWAHLHFEIRRNLQIGMNRGDFARNTSNYHDPTYFISQRRQLHAEFRAVRIPVNTFSPGTSSEFDDFLARIADSAASAAAASGSSRKEVRMTTVSPPPSEETSEADRGEREKIRSFWDKLRSGSVTPGDGPA